MIYAKNSWIKKSGNRLNNGEAQKNFWPYLEIKLLRQMRQKEKVETINL